MLFLTVTLTLTIVSIPTSNGLIDYLFSQFASTVLSTQLISIENCPTDVNVDGNPLRHPGVNFYFSDQTHNTVQLNDYNLNLVNSSKTTVLMLNGYLCPWDMQGFLNIKNNYVNCKGYQVINVDWDQYSIQISYRNVVCNTKIVGKLVTKLILEKLRLPFERLRCTGLSLGAQICGDVGKQLQILVPNKKLYRITGIDPAGPAYVNASDKNRLVKTDATFVDVIHTNAGMMGYSQPCGTVDYWVNGGKKQPCCPLCTYDQIGYGDAYKAFFSVFTMATACNHVVSVKYLADSICTDQYKAQFCTDYKNVPNSCFFNQTVTFGENINVNAAMPGNYYLKILGYSASPLEGFLQINLK